MRLFVAVWPPAEVLDRVDRLPRPEHPAVRWAPRDRWHVTLRFLGEVDEGQLPALEQALAATAADHSGRRVAMGPVTARLTRSVLVVPVAGLEDLGRAVIVATAGYGAPPEPRAFTGHLTLARSRARGTIPASLAGRPVAAAWDVTEIALVRSRLGGGAGPTYETLARLPLR
jgi:2'-5' RNA ligase